MEKTAARRLWEAIEPLHAIVYFAPEPAAAAKAAGLPSWWMGYFAGRAAPLGPVGPEPVAAMFFGFAPGMVARSLPDAWTFAAPETVLGTRLDAVQATLARTLPANVELEPLAELLEQAVSGCRFDGRPLAAAWAALARPAEPALRVWLAATVLREHRGDGHVLSAVAAGLGGLDTTLTHIATGAIDRPLLQRNRGWTDEEWEASCDRLRARGLLDDDLRLTEAGVAVRSQLEADTDRLAQGPLDALGDQGAAEAIRLAVPLSRHLVDTGVIPMPNPMGAPRP